MIQSALVQKAIQAALNSDWQNAIELNELILQQFPQDLDSLNRLARACFETGDVDRSKKLYSDVLVLDPYNVIASKNVRRFQSFKPDQHTVAHKKNGVTHIRTNASFIEEPGKTKVVCLLRVGTPNVLFSLRAGDCVDLVLKQRGISIATMDGEYIGRLPDDIAHNLHYFITQGNKYETHVKQIAGQSVYIFIREVFRTPEFATRPTFSVTSADSFSPNRDEQLTRSSEEEDSDNSESSEESAD